MKKTDNPQLRENNRLFHMTKLILLQGSQNDLSLGL